MKNIKTAKILTCDDLKQILDSIASSKHAERNRAMILIMVLAGLCVKETAALLVGDVIDECGQVRDEIHLRPEQAKNQQVHSVLICKGLKAELQRYVATLNDLNPAAPLFATQKEPKRGFSQNTLTQHFFWLFKNLGIDASSESCRNTYLHAQHADSSTSAYSFLSLNMFKTK
jgi:integrase/recombinase XerD